MKGAVCGCIVGLALLLAPQQGHAVAFFVDKFPTLTVKDTFSVDVNVGGTPGLTSWQFDLGYNPSILRADLVTEGPFLSSFGTTVFTPGVINNTTGVISLVANSFVDLTPPPSGSGALASVQFTALRPGFSSLSASNVFLNFLNSGFTVTKGSASIGGTAGAAEPSTVALLSLGLGIWYFLQRRQGVRR
jgi:hypothetical protein